MKSHTHKKRFGQNFLINTEIIEHIIASIAPKSDDTLVEIGTGTGALTYPLLERLNALHIVEIDTELINFWQQQAIANLYIHHMDVLKFNISSLGNNVRIVGNLPYNISSPILFHMVNHRAHITDMVFMLQKEVAERIVAEPTTKVYGRLSVMIQAYFESELLFDVPNTAFEPMPKVTSSIIYLRPKHNTLPKYFTEVVKHAFRMKRKTLGNNLKDILPKTHSTIDMSKRAENCSVDDFIQLATEYETYLSAW